MLVLLIHFIRFIRVISIEAMVRFSPESGDVESVTFVPLPKGIRATLY